MHACLSGPCVAALTLSEEIFSVCFWPISYGSQGNSAGNAAFGDQSKGCAKHVVELVPSHAVHHHEHSSLSCR